MSLKTPMATVERQPCRYSARDWEKAKTTISRLYIAENKTIKEVITALEGELGMVASEKQLKSRLTKWGLDIKNLKGETIIRLARTREKRKLENKETGFRIRKRMVEEHKIDRYLRSKDISAGDLLDMASPVNAPSPAFSVFTPPPCCSPTPDLGFASLSIQTDYTDAVQANQLQVDETETNEFQIEHTNAFQANEVQADEIEIDESEASPGPTISLKTPTSLSAKLPTTENRYQYRKRIVQEIGDYLRSNDISTDILHASWSHAKVLSWAYEVLPSSSPGSPMAEQELIPESIKFDEEYRAFLRAVPELGGIHQVLETPRQAWRTPTLDPWASIMPQPPLVSEALHREFSEWFNI